MRIPDSLSYARPALDNMVEGINLQNPRLIRQSTKQVEGFIDNPDPVLKLLSPHEVINVADTALDLTRDFNIPERIKVTGFSDPYEFTNDYERHFFCDDVGELIWMLKRKMTNLFRIERQLETLIGDNGLLSLDKMTEAAIEFLRGGSPFPDFKGKSGVYTLPDPKELANFAVEKQATQVRLTEDGLAVVQALPFNGIEIAAFI